MSLDKIFSYKSWGEALLNDEFIDDIIEAMLIQGLAIQEYNEAQLGTD